MHRAQRSGFAVVVVVVVVVGMAAGCPDAPEAVNPFPQVAPILNGSVQSGVTADGEGRASIPVSTGFGGVGNGFVGVRAKLSDDGGLTFFDRRPRSRFAPTSGLVILDGLDSDVELSVALVSVSNLGIESAFDPGLLVPVSIPAASTDVDAPGSPTLNPPIRAPGGVALTWSDVGGDTFAYDVERNVDGAGFVKVARVLGSLEPGYFDADVATGSVFEWQVITEDLSGNRSAPSDLVSVGGV
ncbi:MAG: hypothetical protein Q8O67_19995 [Deltaproteobacteria bacterium]|nr:hypothetical protein [Deltaproteobacteria bacterium]